MLYKKTYHAQGLSSRLKTLRNAKGLTQSQIGQAIGVSAQAINEIEHGRKTTTTEKLIYLADVFDVSLDYLVGRTDDCSFPNIQSAAPALLTEQKELLQLFEKLSTLDQGRILERMHILIEEGTGSTSK